MGKSMKAPPFNEWDQKHRKPKNRVHSSLIEGLDYG